MNTITISIPSVDFEMQDIELSEPQVLALYTVKKEQLLKITELEKKLTSLEQSLKYSQDNLSETKAELQQGHALLSALGVKEKTEEEETYMRRPLNLSTRLALFFASNAK